LAPLAVGLDVLDEELRLVCAEERIEADVALGAGGELIGELQPPGAGGNGS